LLFSVGFQVCLVHKILVKKSKWTNIPDRVIFVLGIIFPSGVATGVYFGVLGG